MDDEKCCVVRLYQDKSLIAAPVSCLYFPDCANNYTVKATEETIIASDYGKSKTLRIYKDKQAFAVYVLCIKGKTFFC